MTSDPVMAPRRVMLTAISAALIGLTRGLVSVGVLVSAFVMIASLSMLTLCRPGNISEYIGVTARPLRQLSLRRSP
jgi:hypothetical protein